MERKETNEQTKNMDTNSSYRAKTKQRCDVSEHMMSVCVKNEMVLAGPQGPIY